MNALFIGRFQPFHKGHLYVIKTMQNDFDQISIGIGSSQYSHTKKNPFSFSERKMMINQVLTASDISYSLYAIPDIHDPPRWLSHVQSIVPCFDVIVTNNAFTETLCNKQNIPVIKTGFHQKNTCSGSEIRRRIACQQPWQHLVPPAVKDIILSIDGVKRIQQLMESSP